ncbi:hypothetical protein HPC49_13805 [Pyxidicoccus fallax]|uniref:Lipoprotein n=1 Tax=Pyxidicoccus fallax TaxID=394095 RepID=A0A848LLM6_9BACT|nr:hypothetical protein [Pyxidicoccus fallax]NMO18727.1 hypothetical protein [Pyxidicoccus fallax]NPC79308.1 hypothetical protein [Pyxidicoccus fallax]
MKPARLLALPLLLCACATSSPRSPAPRAADTTPPTEQPLPAAPPEAPAASAPRETRELAGEEKEKVLGRLDLLDQEVDRVWLESCPLAPGRSELLRASAGTFDEGGLPWDIELYAPRLDGEVLAVFEDRRRRYPPQGEEEPPWEVRCRPGGLDLGYPDDLVALHLDENGLWFDPRWGRELPARLDRASDATLAHFDAVLVAVRKGTGVDTDADEAAEALLRVLLARAERSLRAAKPSDAGAVLDRAREVLSRASKEEAPWASSLQARARAAELALLRLRLTEAEQALDAENDLLAGARLDAVHATLSAAPAEEPWTSLGARASALSGRVAAARARAPLWVAARHKVGRLSSFPSVPTDDPEDGPDLFWRGGELCVRQTERAGRMRCVDAATRRWKGREPYVSPLSGGWQLSVEEPAKHQWRILLSIPEGGAKQWNHLDWPGHLRVVARGREYDFVIVAERPAGDTSTVDAPPRVEGLESHDLARGPGSLLAGGGELYFAAPDELRATHVEGRSWRFSPGIPDAPKGCAREPLVSPDGKWAACAVDLSSEADPREAYALWLLELVRE